MINSDVIDAGVNGELSRTGSLRLEKLLDRYNPQLLLLCHGANDMLQQRSLDEMADKYLHCAAEVNERIFGKSEISNKNYMKCLEAAE